MDYKERLRAFNSTEKYWNELRFLTHLLDIDMSYSTHETILDYGCGIGTAIDYIKCSGYDINNYYNGDSELYRNEVSFDYMEKIYFMHSLAHIPNPTEVLKDLKERYNATITVITPNAHWLMQQSNNNYVPDPTVVKHYTMTQLKELFVSCGYEVTLLGQFGEEKNGINERIFLQAK